MLEKTILHNSVKAIFAASEGQLLSHISVGFRSWMYGHAAALTLSSTTKPLKVYSRFGIKSGINNVSIISANNHI